jgi:CheY-like chemotaxis protein
VAIVLDHSPELYSSFIGCVLAGLSPTILAPRTPRQDAQVFRESMDVLFSRIQPAAVVTSETARDAVPEGGFDTVLAPEIHAADAEAVRAFVEGLPASGFGQARDRQRAVEAGFAHHLVKPIDMAALVKILQTVVSGQAR